jgi:hypothetical protein
MENPIGFGDDRCYADARLGELVKERMAETGETQQAAELSISRTEEGRARWEEARRVCVNSSGTKGRRGSQQAGVDAGIGLGTVNGHAASELSEMIQTRMAHTGETQQCAEINIIRTEKGAALWEAMRKAALAK